MGGHFSVRFQEWRERSHEKSPHKVHANGQCKCHMPAIVIGQDECVFKSYALS